MHTTAVQETPVCLNCCSSTPSKWPSGCTTSPARDLCIGIWLLGTSWSQRITFARYGSIPMTRSLVVRKDWSDQQILYIHMHTSPRVQPKILMKPNRCMQLHSGRYWFYVYTLVDRLLTLACLVTWLMRPTMLLMAGWFHWSGQPLKQSITASTPLPVMSGAMAACCMRSGVWGINPLKALQTKR